MLTFLLRRCLRGPIYRENASREEGLPTSVNSRVDCRIPPKPDSISKVREGQNSALRGEPLNAGPVQRAGKDPRNTPVGQSSTPQPRTSHGGSPCLPGGEGVAEQGSSC